MNFPTIIFHMFAEGWSAFYRYYNILQGCLTAIKILALGGTRVSTVCFSGRMIAHYAASIVLIYDNSRPLNFFTSKKLVALDYSLHDWLALD